MAQGAQTADRAIGVLMLAVESDGPVGLAELGRLAGLNKPATYRLVQTLVARSLLERQPDGSGYVVGTGLIALAGTVMRKLAIREAARPAMERVAQATTETVTLHVRHVRYHVCVEVRESPHQIRRVVPLGEMVSLLDGTGSKSMLPWVRPSEFEQIMAWAAEEGRDVKRLKRQIDQSRRDGYYAAVGDRVPGGAALSVPIFDSLGVKGCMTVAGPEGRFKPEVMRDAAPLVVEECAQLSRSLGHVSDTAPVAGAVAAR